MKNIYCLKTHHKILITFLALIIIFPSYVFAETYNYGYTKLVDGESWGNEVAVDSDGNSYVVGEFYDEANFGEGEDTSIRTATNSEGFLTKYDSDGTRIWTKTFTSTSSSGILAVTVDTSNNIYIGGRFTGTTDFGEGGDTASRTSAGSNDGFIVKYESDGTRVWTKTFGGTGPEDIVGIDTDTDGNIYVTGAFAGTADFGEGGDTASRTSAGAYDIYASKYDSNGNREWTKSFGSAQTETPGEISTDSSNNVYLTGSFSLTVDFGAGDDTASRTSNGNEDAFLTKYDTDGNRSWTKTFGGDTQDKGRAVATDSDDNVFLVGEFRNTTDFGEGEDTASRTSNGFADIFTTKYQSDGTRVWTNTFGSTSGESTDGIATDSAGNVYLTGGFALTADFDPTDEGTDTIDSDSDWDYSMYVTSYDNDGTYLWTKTTTGGNQTCAYGVAQGSDSVFVTGEAYGEINFDPQGEGDIQTADPDIGNMYLTKYAVPVTETPITTVINNSFSKDLKCRWESPEETTWIIINPEVKEDISGMNITWTQYSADKVDILIDDGTGNFPWKIEKNSNDGHEFLPNVQQWQKIKIRPINHCAKGNFSNGISFNEYPHGWFNIK